MDTFTILCASILFFIILVKIMKKSEAKNSVIKLPPGPKILPMIGNMHQLLGSLTHHKLRDLAMTYGTLMHLQLGKISTIIVSSPEFVKEIMQTHDVLFAQRPYLLAASVISYNYNIGLADNLEDNVDASAGGAFLSKPFRECKVLLDKMAQNSVWMTRDSTITLVVHSVALDPNNSIAENMATLITQISIITKKIDESGQKKVDITNGGLCTPCINQSYVCLWSDESDNQNYQEKINFVGNYGG
nr:cytochrome P450 71D11-like [Nicotiana tomentosiformis]